MFERIVQRAQPHLSEQRRQLFAPWVIIAGIMVVMLVTAVALFMWTGQMLGAGSASNQPNTKTLAPGTGPSTVIRPAASPSAAATIAPPTSLAPQPTATQPPPRPTATSSVVKYKVKPGDTLLEIAIKYGVSVQAIMKANGMKTDVIRIGDELTIPPAPN